MKKLLFALSLSLSYHISLSCSFSGGERGYGGGGGGGGGGQRREEERRQVRSPSGKNGKKIKKVPPPLTQKEEENSIAQMSTSSLLMQRMKIKSFRSYSSHKEILFGGAGRTALARGVDILANAVAATLGPKGRNVLIGKGRERERERRSIDNDIYMTRDHKAHIIILYSYHITTSNNTL
jgi:hypothetical protein